MPGFQHKKIWPTATSVYNSVQFQPVPDSRHASGDFPEGSNVAGIPHGAAVNQECLCVVRAAGRAIRRKGSREEGGRKRKQWD